MRLPPFVRRLALGCLTLPIACPGAWSDTARGEPVVEVFPVRALDTSDAGGCLAQDAHGRLFVGGERLLVYDGIEWKSLAWPGPGAIHALRADRHGRLWAGGGNELGFFADSALGHWAYTSLRDRLPPEHRQLGDVTACAEIGGRIFFIGRNKVLQWDGANFTVWSLPNPTRLVALHQGDDLWLTRPGTGLYRITLDGPHLVYTAAQLPAHSVVWLQNDAHGLRMFGEDGMLAAGQLQRTPGTAELDEFLHRNPPTCAAPLTDGGVALGTANGLAIVSPTGKLLRVLRQDDGLPGDAVSDLLLDREQKLWITFSAGTALCRMNASTAATVFRAGPHSRLTGVADLASAHDGIYAATASGLYVLPDGMQRTLRFQTVPVPGASGSCLCAWGDGLLVGDFGTIDYVVHGQRSTVLALPSTNFTAIAASKKDPAVLYCIENRSVARLRQNERGTWTNEILGALPDWTDDLYVDPQDRLWLGSYRHGVWRFDPATGECRNVHDGVRIGAPVELSNVTGAGEGVYFFTAGAAFAADAATGAIRPLRDFPTVHTLGCAFAADNRTLYVVFERENLAKGKTYGAGRFRFSPDGSAAEWAELQAPELASTGAPLPVLVTTDADGSDTVWVGGSDGIVCLKPGEIPTARPPASPWLQVTDATGQQLPEDASPSLGFADHHLFIQVGSPEIDTRSELQFETRLGPDGRWSAASPQTIFEFSNLKNGAYRFEARTKNAAGLSSEPAAFVFRVRPPWYRSFWAYVTYLLAVAAGVYGLVRTRERITRRRTAALEALVRQRTAELVKSSAAKDEFLASVSHEIRNPLNGVVGLAATVNTTALDPESRRRFAQLRHCANHLSGLLEDVLDFSRLQSDPAVLNPQPFDLAALIESISALAAAESARSGLPLETAVAPGSPRHLFGDVARLRQIVLNYVCNALQYAGRGKVCLTVWSRPLPDDRAAVTFAVSDDGPGISPEEQARLFTRFERGVAARTRRVAGTGLGLAVCKTLGERMGGRLWVESASGAGSTFFFEVPLPLASESAVTRAATFSGDGQHLHALVVEDEEYNRLALSALLEEAGFVVASATDCASAVRAVLDGNFAAVFLDISLNGESGLDVARALRALPQLDLPLPIFATTAYATEDMKRQCLDAGMNGFLSKPVTPEKIRAAFAVCQAERSPNLANNPPTIDGPATLSVIRRIAEQKGLNLSEELRLFFREVDDEAALLAEAVRSHDPRAVQAAHRLAGRLTLLRTRPEVVLTRQVEAHALNALWTSAEASVRELEQSLAGLRARFAVGN